ncbi:AbrB/MazE/SpoVT family DNA-binding domain-containing protein [bacterium]|nr:AbrB/MazE/SpoVT family DNA-binding domain-containing protein [bacterium]
MLTVQLQQDGQLALPVDFREKLGLKPGDIFNAELVDNKIILIPQVYIESSEAERIEAKKRFFEIVDKVRKRTEDIPLEEIQSAVDEAVAFAKEQELKELLGKDNVRFAHRRLRLTV